MLARWVYLAGAVLALAAPASAAGGTTVVAKGACVVTGGIHTPSGAPAAAWDMWQEIFLTSSPTWLAAHTHHGAECVMNVYGVTSWWFAHAGDAPSAPPTIVPLTFGKTAYTVQGRVHTAGDAGPRMQAYLGIHLLEQGSAFGYPASDPNAPPVVKTNPVSIFKNDMPNQVPSKGTFTIANQMIEFTPGGTLTIPASAALGYYTVVGGEARIAMGGAPQLMAPGKTYVVGRGVAATIHATLPTNLVATELIPGVHG
jgi:hypothetical protein